MSFNKEEEEKVKVTHGGGGDSWVEHNTPAHFLSFVSSFGGYQSQKEDVFC